MAQRLIEEYLAVAKHGRGQDGADLDGPLFRPVTNNRTGTLDKHLDPGSVYRNIVSKYGKVTGINAEVNGLCMHSLWATAATNAFSHDANIAKVQKWIEHANVSTTRLRPAQNPPRGQSDADASCEVLSWQIECFAGRTDCIK